MRILNDVVLAIGDVTVVAVDDMANIVVNTIIIGYLIDH